VGAIKPWHVLSLLCCLLVVTGGVAGILAAVHFAGKKK
jgi:hypothetical protein